MPTTATAELTAAFLLTAIDMELAALRKNWMESEKPEESQFWWTRIEAALDARNVIAPPPREKAEKLKS